MDEKILYLDCASGISGDMTVGALLDLGASREKLVRALDSLGVSGYHLHFGRTKKCGIDAYDFDVHLEEEEHHHDHEHHHHDHDHDDHDHECCCGHHHDDDEDEREHHHHHDHDEDEHEHHHHHDHDEDHDHDHHHHHHADEVFTSWGIETPNTYSAEDIEKILTALDSGEYGAILRAKGMVPAPDGTWVYYDYVPEEHDIRSGKPEVTGKICVIGSKLDEDKLAELFRK